MKLCPNFVKLVSTLIILNVFVYETLCQRVILPSYVIEGEGLPSVTWANVANQKVKPQSAQLRSSYISYNANTQGGANPSIKNAQLVLQPPSEINPNVFQKRALDFMYHKFVEPKTHQHVEPRPSLIEELIGTFETHVKKDLAAWNRNSGESTSKRETPQAPPGAINNDMDVQSSDNVLIGSGGVESIINSVTNVEEGEADDTFIVTDDVGKKHVITVDEIINSLSHLNENEINHLLLDSAPIEPGIERADELYSVYEDPSALPSGIRPFISKDIQYSRKGVQDDDIILIQSEDGDTRLVTVKDARLSTQEQIDKGIKNKKQNLKTVYSPSHGANNLPREQIYDFNFKDFHGQSSINSFTKSKPPNHEKFVYSPSETTIRKSQLLNDNNNNNNHNNNNNNNNLLKNIETKKKKAVLATPSASHLQGVTAPNSPPLKVINTEASIIDFLPFQNTVTIKGNSPPIIQKTGIRKRLSNFFSRLVGKTSKDRLNISNRDDLDQFVQIVMPRSDSNTMEQITIPLPKAIHHKGRNIQVQDGSNNSNKRNRPRRRSSISDLFKKKEKKEKIEERSHYVGGDKKVMTTAELILKNAQVPDAIKEKLMAQMNDKPEYLLPNFNKFQDDEQIDRSDRYHNKETKKDIVFPVGYKYEIPPAFENYDPHYHQEVYYDKHKNKKDKKKGYVDDDQPLLDINLLADLVFVSKTGDDNESFSFPKIGDSSKFVDVRRVQY